VVPWETVREIMEGIMSRASISISPATDEREG
jgi:hypothetical protein